MERRREVDAKICLQIDVEKRTRFVSRQCHLVELPAAPLDRMWGG
jgi:hypothetical protein